MTNETLPAPLLPADVDLNGYQFMPLYGHRLFGSEFNARCSDAAWRAGVTLWWAAWNQVPAASLPDDDAALCRLADLGRDVKAWRKIRADALHGFVKCSDGRLYHRALAEYAAEAWDRRVRDRARKAAWRAGRNADGERDGTRTETGTRTGQGRDVPADRDSDRDRERDSDRDRSKKEGEAKSPPDLGEGRQVELLSGAPPQDRPPIDEAVAAWNELADRKGLARVQKLTDVRKRSLRHRLHDAGGIEGWRAALLKVEASEFLVGTNPRGWRADFDWIITERAFTRLMEGQFERTRSSSSFGEGMRNQIAEAMEAAREIDRLDAEREGRQWPEQQALSQP